MRFCKFCGEPVEYLEEYDDYYCTHCHSYQTKTTSIDGKKGQKGSPAQSSFDSSLPPKKPLKMSAHRKRNIPIFRHREYLVKQEVFTFKPKFRIYNVSGQLMGICEGKVFTWGGEFDFRDTKGRFVARLEGDKSLFNFSNRTFNLIDSHNKHRGKIVAKYGFLKRDWVIYDEHGQYLGSPSEKIWLKNHFEMVDGRGRVLLSVQKKLFEWVDRFHVVVSPLIDPLIALSFAIVVDYFYFTGND
jgi:uncharacterized protein YxjI